MIKDNGNRAFRYVIVHKFDSFSRDTYDLVNDKRKLKTNGYSLLSATENIDESSSKGAMMESLLTGMVKFYSKNPARKVEKGKKETAL